MSGPRTMAIATVEAAHPLRSLLRMLVPYRLRLVGALGAFVVKDSPLWVMPVITAAIIDTVVAGGPVSRLAGLAGVAVVLLVLNVPTSVVFVRLYNGAIRDLGTRLRNGLTQRLQSLSIGFHSRSSAAVIQSKVVRDVENVEMMFQGAGPSALSAALVTIGAVTMTAVNAPQFLLVYLLTVPISVALTAVMRSRSARRNEALRREIERLSSRVGEMASLIPVTRAHGLEHVASERVAISAEGVRNAGLDLDVLNGRFGAATWVAFQVLGVGCVVLAAWVSIEGWLPVSAGQVVLLGSYFALLTGSLTQLIALLPIVTRGNESVKSIAEVLQEPDIERNAGKEVVTSVAGRIELRDVGYAYAGAAGAAVEGVDLEIAEGETVAFVGYSGSGKSTLLNLVLGFLRPTHGTILLDGRDMETLDLRTARRFVSVVPQESVLFEASIRDNVVYGLGDVPDDRVFDALRDANALDIVEGLPQGWDTLVGERGARLSGGQRQRLAIARALVRDPRILLLDEATSALDAESEHQIKTAMANLMRARTTLVVAHRLSTVRSADRIVVLDAGRIAEIGTHEELVGLGGRYSRLHLLQSG
jgi:ATP-binding cassette, subfamily B, bacterial